MPKEKKRPSKKAKAAQKAVAESKLLAAKSARETQAGEEFKSSVVSPRISTANKLRPEKKRG
jgi:hypothetical protein